MMKRYSKRSLRLLRGLLQPETCLTRTRTYHPFLRRAQAFHTSNPWLGIKQHILTDIGEGTKEVQIIQWYVEEGAMVEEWGKLCEVQSDKASVDITSQYSGVVKKLHFERDAIVQVGDAMLDIEVEGEDDAPAPLPEATTREQEVAVVPSEQAADEDNEPPASWDQQTPPPTTPRSAEPKKEPGTHASLATPAVRGLLKEHGIKIEHVEGTGRDGRVLKEDVQKYVAARYSKSMSQPSIPPQPSSLDSKQVETLERLTPVQNQMFKTMTASLSIPHFLYSDTVNITQLSGMRSRLNASRNPETTPKLSYLPFMIKAVSLALNQYPLLNARIDTASNPSKPQLIMRSNHNIGVAMDTPNGLLVPVIKSVNARSIASIALELQRLSQLGQAGKLGTADLSGGTITVSNIGSIGGEVVAPVIVEGQLAIMGMGKVKAVPVFGGADGKSIERAEMLGVSWSADHRVVDGATMARMAKVVQGYLEEPGTMVVEMS